MAVHGLTGEELSRVDAEGNGARRVLIVEDTPSVADALRMALGSLGFDVRLAESGAEALALAGTFRPDAVLIDLGLPDMDGHAVAREIRRHAADGRSPVLAALSGRPEYAGGESDVFDSHMVKPVRLASILAFLEGCRRP